MIKLAFTISSYRLHDFVKLGIKQLSVLAPDCPVLVSDDPGKESPDIKKTCEECGVIYRAAKTRRGHFAGDFQSIVNSLAFAQAAGADVAVKVSQRFVFRKPESVDVIRRTFSDPNIMVATPGQPVVAPGHAKGFGSFSILTDVIMIRVGAIKPEELLHMYRDRLMRERVPWASFIECTIDELHSNHFAGRSAKVQELTNAATSDPIYLRRYQATERQYRDLALKNGFNGLFPLVEWNRLEHGTTYLCRPVVI